MNPILIVALIALAIVVYAASAAIGAHYGYKIGMKEAEVEHKACQADLAIATNKAEQMERDLDECEEKWKKEHAQSTKLREDLLVAVQTFEQLHAQLADRNEALQEARAEIKSLNMRTIEMPEVAPDTPLSYAEAKPAIDKVAQSTKRPARSRKAGTQ